MTRTAATESVDHSVLETGYHPFVSAVGANGVSAFQDGSQDGRLGIVDLMRGLAALMVAWFHAAGHLHGHSWLRDISNPLAWVGVYIFFAISGFVIPIAMDRSRYQVARGFFKYLIKRIVRLDPPYLASIAFALLVAYAANLVPGYRGAAPNVTWKQLLLHLGYLNGLVGYPWVNGVYWTLAIEFQFYLFLGLAFPLLASSRASIRRCVLACLCLGRIFPWTQASFGGDPFVYLAPNLDVFMTGILAFQAFTRRITWNELLISFFVVGMSSYFRKEVMIAAFASLMFVTHRYELGPVTSFLAKISYSLYLTHVPIVRSIVHLGGRVFSQSLATDLLLVIVAVTTSIMFAYAFWWAIERPTNRLAHFLFRPKPKASS